MNLLNVLILAALAKEQIEADQFDDLYDENDVGNLYTGSVAPNQFEPGLTDENTKGTLYDEGELYNPSLARGLTDEKQTVSPDCYFCWLGRIFDKIFAWWERVFDKIFAWYTAPTPTDDTTTTTTTTTPVTTTKTTTPSVWERMLNSKTGNAIASEVGRTTREFATEALEINKQKMLNKIREDNDEKGENYFGGDMMNDEIRMDERYDNDENGRNMEWQGDLTDKSYGNDLDGYASESGRGRDRGLGESLDADHMNYKSGNDLDGYASESGRGRDRGLGESLDADHMNYKSGNDLDGYASRDSDLDANPREQPIAPTQSNNNDEPNPTTEKPEQVATQKKRGIKERLAEKRKTVSNWTKRKISNTRNRFKKMAQKTKNLAKKTKSKFGSFLKRGKKATQKTRDLGKKAIKKTKYLAKKTKNKFRSLLKRGKKATQKKRGFFSRMKGKMTKGLGKKKKGLFGSLSKRGKKSGGLFGGMKGKMSGLFKSKRR